MLAASTLLLLACEPKPQPIQYGSDQCEYCRMMITEPEYASQVLNKQGRAFNFDSIECMAAYDQTTEAQDNIHSRWVPDFSVAGEEWVNALDAHYLHSETLRSPMGLSLSAYADEEAAEEYQQEYRGELLDWNGVRDLVRREWLEDAIDPAEMHQ